jgi:hypothetical protein
MGELIEGAMQQAAQRSRHFIAQLSRAQAALLVTYPQPAAKIQGLPAPALMAFFTALFTAL